MLMIDESKFIAAFREINEVEERAARNAYMMYEAAGRNDRRINYFPETAYLQRLPSPLDGLVPTLERGRNLPM